MKKYGANIRNALALVSQTGGNKLFFGFLVFYLIDCFLLLLFDESLETYFDALWLGFNIATSIGLGDYTVTSAMARIFAVALGVYGAVIAAYIPGLAASLYIQKLDEKHRQLMNAYKSELAHASNLSAQRRKEIADEIRKGLKTGQIQGKEIKEGSIADGKQKDREKEGKGES